MGIREALNKRQSLVSAIVIVLVAGLAWFTYSYMTAKPSALSKAFYTDDDGKTWFVDSLDRIPPFDHNGKPACRAYVFECGGKRFVGFMERYTDKAKAMLLKAREQPKESQVATSGPPKNGVDWDEITMHGRECKRPGVVEWTNEFDALTALKVRDVKCENGTTPELADP